MAVYPDKYCIGFCYWMLNTSWQELTPPRLDLITTVYNAAVAGSSVTDLEYNNFTQTTYWRLPYYQSYLTNQLPYSVNPVGTCDAWLNASGLRSNTVNSFGTSLTNGYITRLNDILGGAVFGSQATVSRQPSVINQFNNYNQPYSIGFNPSAATNLLLTNAGALNQNSAGYTIIAVANFGLTGTLAYLVSFSTGTAAGNPRIALAANAAGAFQAQVRRLDADATTILQGGAVSNSFQIFAFTMNWGTGRGDLYINGSSVASNAALTTAGNTSNTASLSVSLGSLNQASIWNGCILDCLFFQTALSAANILTLSNWLNGLRSLY